MNIRAAHFSDIDAIRKIHERHFKNEFDFCEFQNNFLGCFVTEDDKGIISAGGVRTIAECLIVTDMDRRVRDRKTALYNILQTSMHIANRAGYNQLHAFIQDENWERILYKTGFQKTVGKSLVIGT